MNEGPLRRKGFYSGNRPLLTRSLRSGTAASERSRTLLAPCKDCFFELAGTIREPCERPWLKHHACL
jgi:hypothetical protein